jgi:hypothetical protein
MFSLFVVIIIIINIIIFYLLFVNYIYMSESETCYSPIDSTIVILDPTNLSSMEKLITVMLWVAQLCFMYIQVIR